VWPYPVLSTQPTSSLTEQRTYEILGAMDRGRVARIGAANRLPVWAGSPLGSWGGFHGSGGGRIGVRWLLGVAAEVEEAGMGIGSVDAVLGDAAVGLDGFDRVFGFGAVLAVDCTVVVAEIRHLLLHL
jgi:hypothetical protein